MNATPAADALTVAQPPTLIDGDGVVTIHGGDHLYRVVMLGHDDMARVAPLAADDTREPFWVSADSLAAAEPPADLCSICDTAPCTSGCGDRRANG